MGESGAGDKKSLGGPHTTSPVPGAWEEPAGLVLLSLFGTFEPTPLIRRIRDGVGDSTLKS